MKKLKFKNRGYIYSLFAIPTILYIITFKFIPFIGNVIAFMDYKLMKGIFRSEWIGLAHFTRMFQSEIFKNAFINTLRLNFLDLLIGFPSTILLSLILVEIKAKLRNVLQTCLYIPYFISWSALGGIIVQMLSPSVGVVAAIGKLFAIDYSNLPILLGNDSSWIVIYVLAGIWQYAGWGTIVYVSAILSIDANLYEQAQIDGASKFQQMYLITLPMIKPIVLLMLILKISGILSTNFEQVYVLSNSMVLDVSDVLSTYEYRVGLQSMQFSYATAVGLLKSTLGLAFVFIARLVVKRISSENNKYD